MLGKLHDHIVDELQQNARTDTVFVVAAVLFNLVVLGINWAVASSGRDGDRGAGDVIFALLVVATVAINGFCLRALASGRSTRLKLVRGLLEMYRDNDVARYYDESLVANYGARYSMFMAVTGVLAALAIVVPFIARLAD
jgi:hypothetical protein